MHRPWSQFSQKHQGSTNDFAAMKERDPSASSQKENSLNLIGENAGVEGDRSSFPKKASWL
jgi:hypothetical protein